MRPRRSTQIDITNNNVSNPRPLRVVIDPTTSSGIKLCDPDPRVASDDPRSAHLSELTSCDGAMQ